MKYNCVSREYQLRTLLNPHSLYEKNDTKKDELDEDTKFTRRVDLALSVVMLILMVILGNDFFIPRIFVQMLVFRKLIEVFPKYNGMSPLFWEIEMLYVLFSNKESYYGVKNPFKRP